LIGPNGLLANKGGLVIGVANEHSIAAGCAQAARCGRDQAAATI
jgi:enoyl-[acyl-carrier-protein] reductase (NADH)